MARRSTNLAGCGRLELRAGSIGKTTSKCEIRDYEAFQRGVIGRKACFSSKSVSNLMRNERCV